MGCHSSLISCEKEIKLKTVSGLGGTSDSKSSSISLGMLGVLVMEGVSVIVGVSVIDGVMVMLGVMVIVGVWVIVGEGEIK